MAVKYKNFTFDNHIIDAINDKNKQVVAHEFNEYLHFSHIAGKPIIEVLKDLRFNTEEIEDIPEERNLNLTIKEQEKIVIDFYNSLNPNLGKQVDKIINKQDNRYIYNFTNNKNCEGNTGFRGSSTQKIHVDVSSNGSILGLRMLAHELAHAISAEKTTAYNIVNNNGDAVSYFKHLGLFNVDSISEIETHIVEYLFMDYLIDKEIINQDDYNLYLKDRRNAFIKHLNTNIEESFILDNLPRNFNMQDLEKFTNKIGKGIIKSKRYHKTMKRLIHDYHRDQNKGYAQYDFRYVVGEIVSTNWHEQYLLSNNQEKQEMINKFIEYLSKTDSFELSSACKLLLNTSIGDTITNYQQNIQNTHTN